MSETSIPKVTYQFSCLDGPSKDVEFVVFRVWLAEYVNAPYELHLEITTEMPVDVRALPGTSIEFVMAREGEAFGSLLDHARTVFGVIANAEFLGSGVEDGDASNVGHSVFGLTVVPAVSLLQQGTAARIFQDQSVQDVLGAVLKPALTPYDRTFDPGEKLRATEPRDYCVQYHESDFAFASRLLEEEGISYYFVHDVDKGHEVLTFTYDNDAFKDVANVNGSRVFPLARRSSGIADVESIDRFSWRAALTTTGVRRMDYDIMEPFKPLIIEGDSPDANKRSRRLYFATRRRYVTDDVEDRARDHLEVAQIEGEIFTGMSTALDFRPGAVFEVQSQGDIIEGLERPYLLTQVVHSGFVTEASPFPVSEDERLSDDLPRYTNTFYCIPADVPLRPAQITSKPKIEGVQTGIVSGPSSEEIHVDDLGRIVVQFHWEEEPTYDDMSSCWVRVSQTWAGPSWGAMFIPRIGMEVIVTFLEGNPDRPLVTGCVYNGKAPLPYSLPADKTKSTIKSNSSPGGDGFNEFRFEDAAGKEEVFLHAQKDHNEVVKNNMSTSVGNDQSLSVGNNRTKSIKGNETITINKDRKTTIDGSDSIFIKGSYKLQIDGSSHLGEGDDPDELGTGMTIIGQYNISASDKFVVGVGPVCPPSAAPSKLIMDTSTVLLETTDSITIKCGASQIKMTPSEIVVTSPHIQAASADGSILDLKANAELVTPGTVTVHNDGGAKVTLTSAEATTKATQIGLLSSNGEVLADGAGVGLKGTKIDISGDAQVSISGGGATGSFMGGMVKLN